MRQLYPYLRFWSLCLCCALWPGVWANAVTLPQMMRQALRTHPRLAGERANARAASQRVLQARAGYLPSIQLDAARGREKSDTDVGTVDDVRLTRRESSVRLDQLLFDGFGVVNQVRESRALTDAARQQQRTVADAIALQTAEAYLDVLRARRQLDLAKKNIQAHEQTLKKVTAKYKAGAGVKGDRLLALGRLARARAALVRIKAGLENANAAFTAVIGGPVPFKLKKVPSLQVKLPKRLADAVTLARHQSPLLSQANWAFKASRYAARAALAPFWPTLSLAISASHNQNLDGIRGHNNDELFMLNMTYTVVNGGADLARVRETVARREQQLDSLSDARRNLVLQVTQEWQQLQMARQRLPDLKIHVTSSEQVLEAFLIQFKLGKRALFNVLDEENELFDARIQLLNGRDAVRRGEIRLLATLGILRDTLLERKT